MEATSVYRFEVRQELRIWSSGLGGLGLGVMGFGYRFWRFTVWV